LSIDSAYALPHVTTRAPSRAVAADVVAGIALLAIALVIGLATAADYGLTVDEFNTDDYGPKALAWYTSGFKDRSHFETVEFSLWYYGPWFHMLTAYVQSFDFADRVTVRHVMTFLVGLAGVAALLPIGRLAAGRWAGLTAIALCLMTGYLYGNLFFAPIDVPFLAAMTWATLAILVMTRDALPSWRATFVTGALTGMAIASRTGGIITHAYLLGALMLCAAQFFADHGRLTPRYLAQIGSRYGTVVVVAWIVAIALWPWLQIGNPFTQFRIALVHFANMPMVFEFSHWGERIMTDALPLTYIPAQLLARLPGAFLILLAVVFGYGVASTIVLARKTAAKWRLDRDAGLRAAALTLGRARGILVVCAAVVLPLGFLILQRATIYDGIRHVLFVIPMLAILAGVGLTAVLPLLRRAPVAAAIAAGAYVGSIVVTLAALHPLEYVAMNALAGGTRGAYDKFELDYWSVAATEALRRLERRLDYDLPNGFAEAPPSILICIPWREWMVEPMLKRPWIIETDPDKADFIIETQRSRCAAGKPVVLIASSQLSYLKSIAALTPLPLPAGADRAQDRAELLRARISEHLERGNVDAELITLEPLFERWDPAEVAAALLALNRQPPTVTDDAATVSAAPDQWVKVFVTVGKKDRAGPKDLVGALIKEVGLEKAQIGRIDLRENFALVEVAPGAADTVVRRLTGVTIKGRRVAARLDRGT